MDNNKVKVDIAIGKGKKLRDQREDIKKEIGREIKTEFLKIRINKILRV